MEINPEPIALEGAPRVNRPGRDLSEWITRLSDTPSKEWRRVFNAAGDKDRRGVGFRAHVRRDLVRFEATDGTLHDRIRQIEAWIKLANEASALSMPTPPPAGRGTA